MSDINNQKIYIKPIKWCHYMLNVAYVTVFIIILAHVIWFFAARSILAHPADVYLRDYIIYPGIGLFALTFFVDRLVRICKISIQIKEVMTLSLFTSYSLHLCLTHDIATVLLGSFVLSIFASTIFSNIKLTRIMFYVSVLAIMILSVIFYSKEKLSADMIMQLFVACFICLCAYLLAKLLIRYEIDNLATMRNIDKQHRYMQEQIKLDAFTGLYNRKTFDDHLRSIMQECCETGKYLALGIIDVDQFKQVNDNHGHASGDQLLLQLSQILKNVQADNIHSYRLGGDEFVVLFKGCTPEEAQQFFEILRLRISMITNDFMDIKKITVSCGLVCEIPSVVDPIEFTKKADSALYQAKSNGRNQVVIYKNYQ